MIQILHKTVKHTFIILTPEPIFTNKYGNIFGSAVWNSYSGLPCRWYTNASSLIFFSRKLQPFIRQAISSSLSTLEKHIYIFYLLIWSSHIYRRKVLEENDKGWPHLEFMIQVMSDMILIHTWDCKGRQTNLLFLFKWNDLYNW